MSAVAATARGGGTTSLAEPLVAHVARRWPVWGAEGGAPVRGVLLGIDRSPDAKVVCLLFDAAGRLVAVAKAARSAAGEHALAVECDALQALDRSRSRRLDLTVPRVLGTVSVAGRRGLVETPAAGRPMSSDYYAAGHVGDACAVTVDFEAAAGWLDVLHRGTSLGCTTAAEAARRWLHPVLDGYLSDVGHDPEARDLVAAVRARLERLGDALVPVTAVHGDFWMGNLLRVRPGEVSSVVDWERSRPAGVPLGDVFKFPTSYGMYLDRAEPWRRGRLPGHPGRAKLAARWSADGTAPNVLGFGYTWFGDGWFPALARSFVTDGLGRLGVPPAVAGPFFVGFLAEQLLAANTEDFRAGYRQILRAFAAERDGSWLWHA
jgi:hypothetical protein